jgi:hypothetical protein
MSKVMPLQQALKFFLVMVGALVALWAGSALSDRLVTNPSAGVRWLGVAAAVVSLLPWLWVIFQSISHADEYIRRVVLVGTAAAFVVDLLFHVAFNVIVDARLVSATSYLPALPVAIVIWMLSVAVTFLYYRASL